MIFADINITAPGVLESTIVYGIVHGIWVGIKWAFKYLETESGRIIKTHVKAGHKTPYKDCRQDDCGQLV